MDRGTRSIKLEMALMTGVFLLLLFAVGGSGVYGLSKLRLYLNDSYARSAAPSRELSEIRAAQLDILLQLRMIELARDREGVNERRARIRSGEERMDRAWASYYRAISSDKKHETTEKTGAYLKQFEALTNQMGSALEANNLDAVQPAMIELAAVAAKLSESIDADANMVESLAKGFVASGESTFESARLFIVVLIGISVLVGMACAIYGMRTMLGPLGVAVDIANEIAAGKLENGITVASQNELGRLLESLQKMDQQLGRTVRGIQTSAESVATASREIASGNADLSVRTEMQAVSLEKTASSVTQLTVTVKHNANNAREASALAARANSMVDTGDQAVQRMIDVINQISGSSSEISGITGLIEGVAFQTNILALNAAVEAARAGEQGRGFAVVASEVRSLAQRSAAAAKEIKDLLGSSVSMIQDGARQAVDVGKTMRLVSETIQAVAKVVGEIAVASEEQSQGIEQLNQAILQMDQMTQQNAALVEQATAAAQSLEEQAASLKSSVSIFRFTN